MAPPATVKCHNNFCFKLLLFVGCIIFLMLKLPKKVFGSEDFVSQVCFPFETNTCAGLIYLQHVL